MITGFSCANCFMQSDEHADEGQCLFAPTKFRFMNAVELLSAREAERWGGIAYGQFPGFTTFQTVGVGVANVGAVSKLRWNGGAPPVVVVPRNVVASFTGGQLPAKPPRVFTVSGTDQFGNPVTEEL